MLVRSLSISILLLSSLIPVLFLLNNLKPVSPPLHLVVIIAVIFSLVLISLLKLKLFREISGRIRTFSKRKHFTLYTLLLSVLLGILIRIYFYVKYSYTPVSDPQVFVEAASKISSGQGISGDFMAGFFPYLVAYENTLAMVMRIVSDPWLAVILLNTLFDLAGALTIFFLVKRLTQPTSSLPLVAFAVWILSPLNILFSVTALPIIMVNFFIILAIYICHILLQRINESDTKGILWLSASFGAAIGLGHWFRPIFSIFIVAIALIFLYLISIKRFRNRKKMAWLGVSFLLIISFFTGLQKINTEIVSQQVGSEVSSNPSGWSIYVGSNFETSGNWSEADQENMASICKNYLSKNDYDGCHDKLREAGLARYRNYGLEGSTELLFKKMHAYTENQGSIYNVEQSVPGYANSRTSKLFSTYTTIFILLIFFLAIKHLLSYSKMLVDDSKHPEPFILLVGLMILGFSLSTILVESAPRYAIILYPLFTILGILSFKRQCSYE